MRTPLFPFSVLEAEGDGMDGRASAASAARWVHDRRIARERLRARLDLPETREAIFLASPSLDERAAVWREDPDGENAAGIEAGLVKYAARMAARCTPFGTFAANSVGVVGGRTRLAIPDRWSAARHTRLDMDFLSDVAARLGRDPELRARVPFFTNSSLADVGGTLRYAEARIADGKRAYFLVDVEPHEPLRRALACARNGAMLEEIAQAVAGGEIPADVARDFVNELADAQLLLPDLGPAVTGPDALDDLVARLSASGLAGDAVATLVAAREGCVDLDGLGIGAPPESYRVLARDLARLATPDPARLFQVDLAKPAEGLTIASDLVDELLRGVQVLVDLFGRGRRDPLEPFRRAFEDRYGDREVPLVEALDEEIGVGFETAHHPAADPSPLLAGLAFPAPEEEERFAWGRRAQFLVWKLAETLAAGREEMVLTTDEVAPFHDPRGPRMADAFHILATVLRPETDGARPGGPRAWLESASGPSGARLLGRFGHGDPELRACVEAHLRAEEALDPHVIYFEIVHLPEGRLGNILARPRLRDYELSFLGRGGAPAERTLRLDDLTVRLDGERVVLRSRSLDREVRPRLTSAHTAGSRGLGVYRFLAAVQAQGVLEGITWVWGPLDHAPRLPRVRFGSLVLARQQWGGRLDDVRRLTSRAGHEAFRETQAWRAERGIPRWVGLVYADNVLPLDLENPLSVAALLRELRGREAFALLELHPGAGADAAAGPEGRFLNEVIVPVVRREPPARPATPTRPVPAIPAVFPPGSEWLTVKLYAGPSAIDRILLEVIAPLVAEATTAGAMRRWFFLRYADPDWHVRVRFEGDPARLLAEILPALHDACESARREGRLHRTVLEPYAREVLRYGGDAGVLACETIFRADSDAVLAFLAGASGDDGLDARWRFAFLGMDLLLRDLGFDAPRRHAITRDLSRAFLAEFRADGALRRGLSDRARNERRTLDALLAGGDAAAAQLGGGLDVLRARSQAIVEPCAELRALAADGRLASPLEGIAGSLLHMHANRVLRSSPRPQEMVLYSLLERAYDAEIARGRHRLDG